MNNKLLICPECEEEFAAEKGQETGDWCGYCEDDAKMQGLNDDAFALKYED